MTSRAVLRAGGLIAAACWGLVALALAWATPTPYASITYLTYQRASGLVEGLYTADLNRGLTVPLAVADADTFPVAYAWAPHGQRLAILKNGRPGVQRQMHVIEPGGGRQIFRGELFSVGPYWSPDGRWLVLIHEDRVLLLDPTTGDTQALNVLGLVRFHMGYYIPLEGNRVLIRGTRAANTDADVTPYLLDLHTGETSPAQELPCTSSYPTELAYNRPPGAPEVLIYRCLHQDVLYLSDWEGVRPLVPLSRLGGLGDQHGARWSPGGEQVLFTYSPTFPGPGGPTYRHYHLHLGTGDLRQILAGQSATRLGWLPPQS